MKAGHKLAVLGCLAVVVGSAVCWRWMFRMPLKEFTRYALYMAVMDDEICRNELEDSQIGDVVITFPPKAETLQERYHLFLQTNRAKSRRQIREEIVEMSSGSRSPGSTSANPKSSWKSRSPGKTIRDRPVLVHQAQFLTSYQQRIRP